MTTNQRPATVPEAKQAGPTPPEATPRRWAWVEASVWTERMLAALDTGVKGGVWFSLIDKVHKRCNLQASFAKVKDNQGASGVDHVTVTHYEQSLEANLDYLSAALREGTYRPQAIRRAYIPKADGTPRPLGIPTVQDRVVQGAVKHVLEPIFERDFAANSYGFRPGRGCHDALRVVDKLLKEGCRYIVDADLKSYFDTIPHERLLARLRVKVADSRVLALIEAFLQQGIMEDVKEWTPAAGAPQGAVLSPLLSNIYLDPLDHEMAAKGYAWIRYADDFVILCRSEAEAQQALAQVQQWLAEAGLTLHPDKTRIVDIETTSFEFLGYHFCKHKGHHRHWPRKSSVQKLKETLRRKTKRTDGRSLEAIIKSVNLTLRGWFGYFKHSYKPTFPSLDGWIRGRLRSLLRKRHKKKGRGRGSDHQRWPNAYFADCGLFSLVTAHKKACQLLLQVNH
jgi:RNA-directed DNA polymerase